MKIDPKLLEEAKQEILKLKSLSVLTFADEGVAIDGVYSLAFGFKISKKQDDWLTKKANQYTRGKKSAYFRTILDTIMQLDKTSKPKGGAE